MAHIRNPGTARATGSAIEAVKIAVENPLLERRTISGATHDCQYLRRHFLMDANDAVSYVQDLAGDSVNIIFGAKYDDSMVDEATITVIATGLESADAPATGAARCGQSAGQ